MPVPILDIIIKYHQHRDIAWGLVVMGCVVDVVRGYYPVLNEDVQKGGPAAFLRRKHI